MPLRARGAKLRPAPSRARPVGEARGEGGDDARDAQADVPSAEWLRAQLAFKNSMVHGILQFTPSIAFRYVLHRCESRDIRCRESFCTREGRDAPSPPRRGVRGTLRSFRFSLARPAPVFVARRGRPRGAARRATFARPPRRRGGRGAEGRGVPSPRVPPPGSVALRVRGSFLRGSTIDRKSVV